MNMKNYTDRQLAIWKNLTLRVEDNEGLIHPASLSDDQLIEILDLHAAVRANKEGTAWKIARNPGIYTGFSASLLKALRAAERQLKKDISADGKRAVELAAKSTGHIVGDGAGIFGWEMHGTTALYIIKDNCAKNSYIHILRDINGNLNILDAAEVNIVRGE